MIYLFSIHKPDFISGHYYRDYNGRIICIDGSTWYVVNFKSDDVYKIIDIFCEIKIHKKDYVDVDELLGRKKQIKYASELIERKIEELIFNKL